MRNFILGLLALGLIMAFEAIGHAALPHVFALSFDDQANPGKDMSGNGNDATLNGGAKWVAGGHSGGAIEFGDGNDFVEVEIDVPEKNFTMALWIKTDAGDVGVYSVLDNAAGAGGHDRHFYLEGSGEALGGVRPQTSRMENGITSP